MLQSMTGYATKTITLEINTSNRVHVTLSLKSLNSRFFEATCKLPPILSPSETDIIRQLKSNLSRGNIFFIVTFSDINAFKTDVEPSLAALKGYIDAMNTIKKTFAIESSITLQDILRLPNIFITKETHLSDTLKDTFFTALTSLTNELIEERKKEGLQLQKDIEHRITNMQTHIDLITTLFEQDSEHRQQEVAKKLQEITPADAEYGELQRKILYTALDKMDINEEIVRFKAHLHNLRLLIAAPELEKGKQLDFTLQEVGREINTMLAKTSNPTISASALIIKVELEKAREQAQNIL